ncbi:MAG: putative glycoside hydrolase [Candidatus Pacebacteria bacterium]|nr:putative glycoside hydrolase [Candidatus Paceibacterota bacterium]
MAPRKKLKLSKAVVATLCGVGILLSGAALVVSTYPARWEIVHAEVPAPEPEVVEQKPRIAYVPTPEPLYGIYMSQCVSGTPSFRDSLVEFIDTTPLNAVVIDIKDFTGKISFPTDNPILADSVSDECGARDMKEFVARLHEKNIYVIGRITVFQDPYYTKKHPEAAVQSAGIRPGQPWQDHKGLSFIDVSHKPYWDYVVELSRVAHEDIGFDELNYDYIRYPSDGPMSDARFVNPNKPEAVEKFWKYLHEKVDPMGVVMSADLFGYVTVLHDDLGIGQQLERAMPYFDYIMPMVYPSHYNKGFAGLKNPNDDPYTVIHRSMVEAVRRTVATSTPVQTLSGTYIASSSPARYTKAAYSALQQRPWLQDFDYGKDYTAADIDAQIRGTYDAGLTSWIFWDAGNKYSALREYFATSP